MPRLKLHCVERADFSKFYDANTSGGGLFVATPTAPPVGRQVTVEVVFQGGPRVLLHGLVAWRRATGDARARPGVGIAVDAMERAKLNYILAYVRGGLLDMRERKRLPVRLRVAYNAPSGVRRINFTRDINDEGAFVRASELLEVGAKTSLVIAAPSDQYRPFEVRCTVMRLQQDGVEKGMGVKFVFVTDEEKSRWSAFMQRLEADYLEGRLPDDALL